MNNGMLLETMERSQVYREAHEGAILINKGDTYVVNSVNLKNRFVNVSKQDVDYHTMVLNQTDINIKKKLSKTNQKRVGKTENYTGLKNLALLSYSCLEWKNLAPSYCFLCFGVVMTVHL